MEGATMPFSIVYSYCTYVINYKDVLLEYAANMPIFYSLLLPFYNFGGKIDPSLITRWGCQSALPYLVAEFK